MASKLRFETERTISMIWRSSSALNAIASGLAAVT